MAEQWKEISVEWLGNQTFRGANIAVHFLLEGQGVDPKAVEHAIRLSEEKYCSASTMLGAVAKIETTYEIKSKTAGERITAK